jgi:hypothetical protein
VDAGVVQVAREIPAKFRDWQRRTAAAVIDVGADLLKVKDELGYGRFTQWLKTVFPGDRRTAQRFMQVAERIPKSKSDTVSLLPLGLLYTLTADSMPQEIIDEVIADLESGITLEVIRDKIVSRPGAFLLQERARSRRSQRKLDTRATAQELFEEFGRATSSRFLVALADRQVASALRAIIARSDDNAVDGDLPIPGFPHRDLPNPIN